MKFSSKSQIIYTWFISYSMEQNGCFPKSTVNPGCLTYLIHRQNVVVVFELWSCCYQWFNILLFYKLFQADGFPTLLFFPAGNKSFDPVSGKENNIFSLVQTSSILFMVYVFRMFRSWLHLYGSMTILHFLEIEQITVDTDRTVVAFYKFIKKHASIPFKLQKPESTTKPSSPSSAEADAAGEVPSKHVKDEL